MIPVDILAEYTPGFSDYITLPELQHIIRWQMPADYITKQYPQAPAGVWEGTRIPMTWSWCRYEVIIQECMSRSIRLSTDGNMHISNGVQKTKEKWRKVETYRGKLGLTRVMIDDPYISRLTGSESRLPRPSVRRKTSSMILDIGYNRMAWQLNSIRIAAQTPILLPTHTHYPITYNQYLQVYLNHACHS